LAHAKHYGASASQGRGSVGECVTQGQESEQSQESVGQAERASSISTDVANGGNTNGLSSQQTNTCTITFSGEEGARRGLTRQCWPFESREHWAEAQCEFCGIFNGISHKLDTNEIKGISAKKTEKRSCKILSNLQSDIKAQEIWESFRRHEQISDQKVLFSEMYGNQSSEGFPIRGYNRTEIREIQEEQLRILQMFREFMSSSYRREPLQQPPLELENALLFMSYNFASSTRGYCNKEREKCLQLLRKAISSTRIMSHAPCQVKEAWTSFSEEEKDWHIMASIFGIWWSEWPGIPKATNEKIDNHMARLKALGNSVVPVQARKAFQILMGIAS
jgi:hypothetical protein